MVGCRGTRCLWCGSAPPPSPAPWTRSTTTCCSACSWLWTPGSPCARRVAPVHPAPPRPLRLTVPAWAPAATGTVRLRHSGMHRQLPISGQAWHT